MSQHRSRSDVQPRTSEAWSKVRPLFVALTLMFSLLAPVLAGQSPAAAQTGVFCDGLEATIVGTPGDDTITGTESDDVIVSLGGNDTIDALAGDDTICADAGNNTIDAGDGDDTIITGDGNDTIRGRRNADTINSGAGDDTVFGGRGQDAINAGDGDDIIDGGRGQDTIDGGDGEDVIDGGRGNDTIHGRRNADTIDGGTGNDVIYGGRGFDTIDGGEDNDTLFGGRGGDTIDGGDGEDTIDGGPGDNSCINAVTIVNCGETEPEIVLVTGTVTTPDPEDGSAIPVANADITITDAEGVEEIASVTTGTDGTFIATLDETYVGVPLYLFAEAEDYLSQWWFNAATFEEAQPVVYNPDEPPTANFVLEADTASLWGPRPLPAVPDGGDWDVLFGANDFCGSTTLGNIFCLTYDNDPDVPSMVTLVDTDLDGNPISGTVVAADANCFITDTSNTYCLFGPQVRLVPSGAAAGETLTNVASSPYPGAHTCVLSADGDVFCAGPNSAGQLGDGSTDASDSFVQANLPAPAVDIAAEDFASCSVLDTDVVYCWGRRTQTTWPNYTSDPTPTFEFARYVGSEEDRSAPIAPTELSMSNRARCVSLVDGDLWCKQWPNYSSYVNFSDDPVFNGDNVTTVVGGYYHQCAATDGGNVVCWGSDFYEQLGGPASPTQVVGVSGLSSDAEITVGFGHTVVRSSNGSWWWGTTGGYLA